WPTRASSSGSSPTSWSGSARTSSRTPSTPRRSPGCATRSSSSSARRPPGADGHRPMRQLYLAATGQNRGKTTAALGLLDGFLARGLNAGFIKPVGQRTVIEHGQPADEDAVLMKSVFGLPEPYSVMSPVHIPRGFTRAYI